MPSGARKEEAIALESDKTWTCECGHLNTMNSFQLNQGGEAECGKPGCEIITEL